MSTLKIKWEQYIEWLKNRLLQYAKLLNKGATQKQLNTLKAHFDFILPEELFELYSLNNGDKLTKF